MDTNNPQMNALPQILALPRWGFEVPLVYTARGGYVPLPPVCKRMGIAVARQIQRLQDDSFYAPWIERLPVKTSQECVIPTAYTDAGSLCGWLTSTRDEPALT